jgi:inner membrane protein
MTTEENNEVREDLPTENKRQSNKKARPGLKLLLIAGMCAVFFIPQLLLKNLVSERKSTEGEAESEVFEKWAGPQTVTGPVIKVEYSWVEGKDEKKETRTKVILPELLDVKGQVNTKHLKRGIYDFSVYETALDITGQLKLPKDFEKQQGEYEWHFENAKIVVGLPNLRGLSDNVALNLSGTSYDMVAETGNLKGLSCEVDLSQLIEGETLDFSLVLPFKGSGDLMFAPVGQTTTVSLTSDCVTPSFNGYYLPDDRQVDDSGFVASWKVLAINRDYPQVLDDSFLRFNDYGCTNFEESTFGVELKVPVEQYLQTDRAIKYAFLIILLTFAAVFFIEMRKAKPVHPVQYLLVGIALTIFYTLLLSFSEHMNFGLSYLIASEMTIGLIVAFMASVTKDKKTALGIGLLLAVLYAFVYVLLQLESYALLVGSVGLFIILGIAMFASQKIDWYKKKE